MLTGLSHITEVRYFDICWIWHLIKEFIMGSRGKIFACSAAWSQKWLAEIRRCDKSGPKGPWQKLRLEDSLKLSLPKILLFSDDFFLQNGNLYSLTKTLSEVQLGYWIVQLKLFPVCQVGFLFFSRCELIVKEQLQRQSLLTGEGFGSPISHLI